MEITQKMVEMLICEIRILQDKPQYTYKELVNYVTTNYNEVFEQVDRELKARYNIIPNEDGTRDFAQKLSIDDDEMQEFLYKFRYGIIPILARCGERIEANQKSNVLV